MQAHDSKMATESDNLLGTAKTNPAAKESEGADEEQENTLLETITENVELMTENAQEVATEIKEAIVEECQAIAEEAQEVKETFVDELLQKDDGESLFLEMGLTRNLSILPSDLIHAADEQQQTRQDNLQKDDTKPVLPETADDATELSSLQAPIDEETIPFHAYLILLSAVIALSSIGPSLALQQEVHATMKVFWRMSGTATFLLPYALRSTIKDGLPKLVHTHWCTFGLASFCYAVMCVGFVIALDFTSVGNAVIFANSQVVLLLIGKFFVGAPVLLLEGAGALVAFAGGILCTVDASRTTTADVGEHEVSPAWSGWGDIFALISATGGVGYLIFAKSVRGHFHSVYEFMFLNMVGASTFTLIYMLLSGQEVTFDMDIHTGVLGFLNPRYDRLPLELFMVVVCNMTGTLGYVRSMQYFDSIIISVATLMEPVVASLLAFSVGVGVLPGGLGWLGNVLVIVGTVCVLAPSTKKSVP